MASWNREGYKTNTIPGETCEVVTPKTEPVSLRANGLSGALYYSKP
jgi:hypothetical protein